MPSARISRRTLDALSCPAGKDRVFLWDDALAGFGAVRFSSGKCTFVVQFRKNGRSQRVRIGDYGRLTPDQARSQAKQLLGAVERGLNPALERQVAKGTPTLAELVAEYLDNEVRPKRARGTATLYETHFRVHVTPTLGHRKADAITRSDVARLHREIGATRPVTANRVLKTLSGLYTYAHSHGRLPETCLNPAKGIVLFKETAKDRFLTTEEIERLGAALIEAETIGTPWEVDEAKQTAKHAPKPESRRHIHSPYVTGAIRLLLLTGCRLREILDLRWTEIDFERGLLFLPTSKTGKKTIFLNGPALDVIKGPPKVNEFVIAGARVGKSRPDIKKPWQSIRKRAGLDALRLHDLRHSFASIGAGDGLGLPMIGKLLGQKQPSTTARYAHLDADPVKRASEQIASRIAAALKRE